MILAKMLCIRYKTATLLTTIILITIYNILFQYIIILKKKLNKILEIMQDIIEKSYKYLPVFI